MGKWCDDKLCDDKLCDDKLCDDKWCDDKCATPAAQSNNRCRQVPRLPHKVKVDVTKCHACHAKRRGATAPPGDQARHQSQPSASATPATQSEGWMSPSATPAMQNATAPPHDQARHQSQPSAISATPATQSNNRCRQVPRLPHKEKVDVTKCYACHAKRRGATAPPDDQARQSQPSAISATPTTQSEGWMSPSATPATQNEGWMSPSPTPAM